MARCRPFVCFSGCVCARNWSLFVSRRPVQNYLRTCLLLITAVSLQVGVAGRGGSPGRVLDAPYMLFIHWVVSLIPPALPCVPLMLGHGLASLLQSVGHFHSPPLAVSLSFPYTLFVVPPSPYSHSLQIIPHTTFTLRRLQLKSYALCTLTLTLTQSLTHSHNFFVSLAIM